MAKLAVSGFSYSDLIQGLSEAKYKKILVLTGAGISVSSGIPDFRTPGTGLYDNLKQYNLPRPEALFDINFFISNPKPFYTYSKNEEWSNYNPTPTHFFIKMLDDKGVLFYNLTQNIDNLEQKTGINMSKVV
jgi:NAD-dependent SIR2 family protein deacetylase